MLRRIVGIVIAILFIGWLAKNDNAAAHLGSQLGDACRHAATGVGNFFSHLTA